jgi:hypothetical protein
MSASRTMMNDNSKLIKSNRKGKEEQLQDAMEMIVRSSEEEDQAEEERESLEEMLNDRKA